jgi:hypothetical protein
MNEVSYKIETVLQERENKPAERIKYVLFRKIVEYKPRFSMLRGFYKEEQITWKEIDYHYSKTLLIKENFITDYELIGKTEYLDSKGNLVL